MTRNAVVLFLISLTLVGCGKKSSSGGSAAPVCSRDVALMQTVWQNENNRPVDMTNCGPDETCRACDFSDCSGDNDFAVMYDGIEVAVYYYIDESVYAGTWEICGEVLTVELYNGDTVVYNEVLE